MAFLSAAPSLVLASQGIVDPTEVDLEIPVVELIAGLLAALGPAAMAAYLLWRDRRLDDAGFGRRPAGFVAGYGALGALMAVLAVWTLLLFVQIVILIGGGELLTEDVDEDALELTVGTAIAGLAIALTAGVGEEIVYRAYAITRMEEAGYGRAALVAPWALFTVVHLYQGWIAIPVIGVVSAVFIWLYRWKRSIWPVMVAHAGYDVVVLGIALTA